MAKSIVCPNCDSPLLTFIVYWKLVRDLKNRTIDVFFCRKCKQLTNMRTREAMPKGWVYKVEWPPLPRKEMDKIGQIDMDGKIQYIERTINPLPQLNIEPTGEMITTYAIAIEHKNDTQYRTVCRQMTEELLEYRPSWKIPDWYKYKVKKGLA
jgi:uncharacterized protein YlaI